MPLLNLLRDTVAYRLPVRKFFGPSRLEHVGTLPELLFRKRQVVLVVAPQQRSDLVFIRISSNGASLGVDVSHSKIDHLLLCILDSAELRNAIGQRVEKLGK